jgi:hypothetical protein
MITEFLFGHFAKTCGGNFLSFPTWYEYLNKVSGTCSPRIDSLSDIWLIVAAVIEILLRVAGIVAVIFVIYGAVSLITSQGEADKTTRARDTIVNSVVGLAIAIMSAAIVAFIAGKTS